MSSVEDPAVRLRRKYPALCGAMMCGNRGRLQPSGINGGGGTSGSGTGGGTGGAGSGGGGGAGSGEGSRLGLRGGRDTGGSGSGLNGGGVGGAAGDAGGKDLGGVGGAMVSAKESLGAFQNHCISCEPPKERSATPKQHTHT